jgi:hypothetical protein
VKPPARNMTPKMSNGAEDPPVKGKSRPLTDFTTEVDVTADPLVVVDPNGGTVVAVSPVVVEFAGRVVVLAAGAVVGDDGNVVDVVEVGGVVVVEVVGGVVVGVVVVDGIVVVGSGTGSQNCTVEIPGRLLPCPTVGRPAFENDPSRCGGESVMRTEPERPLTITTDTGSVECQLAPRDDACDSVTTALLPAGLSNTYRRP